MAIHLDICVVNTNTLYKHTICIDTYINKTLSIPFCTKSVGKALEFMVENLSSICSTHQGASVQLIVPHEIKR